MIWRHEISRTALAWLIVAAALLIAGIRWFSRSEISDHPWKWRGNIVKPLVFVFLLLAATPSSEALAHVHTQSTIYKLT